MVKDCRTEKGTEKYANYKKKRAASMSAATRRRLAKLDKTPESKRNVTKN